MAGSPFSQVAPDDSPLAGTRSLRVLIADDDRDTVITLMTVLRLEGYDVRGVYNGRDVLRVAQQFEPDAALLDITMPEISGYDLARQLRARYGEKGITLIAITAWRQASDKMLAKIVGFNYHFSKPISPQAIIEVLASLTPRAPDSMRRSPNR